MRLLVTGGAGFIGSHFIRHILQKYPDYQVINLDKLTYAGNMENTADFDRNPRYRFVKGDIASAALVDTLAAEVDTIINFAAETHVDRSIQEAAPFLMSNVVGTQVLLDAAKKHKHPRYIQISTDEVYGDILKGRFTETSPLKPSSPYAASKAAGDLLCLAYRRTYHLPVIISRCSNNYGTHQFPEKLVPFFIKLILQGKKVPLYGDGSNIRDWLHVLDHCRAIDLILHKGEIGEIYNISSNNEHSNLEITRKMLSILDQPKSRIEFVTDRPGHDVRYALDSRKLQNDLGWKPETDFETSFREVVEWYAQRFK